MKKTTFEQMSSGQTFIFNSELFVKLCKPEIKLYGRSYNAIRIGNNKGDLVKFTEKDEVIERDINSCT